MKLLLLLTAGILGGILLQDKVHSLYVIKPSRGITESYRPIPTPTPNSIQVVQTIVKEFAPEGKYVVKQMLDISFCESGWRWDALNRNTNGTTDHSAFQVNSIHTKRFGTGFETSLTENVRVAHEIWKEQGVNPWVCAKILSYK